MRKSWEPKLTDTHPDDKGLILTIIWRPKIERK